MSDPANNPNQPAPPKEKKNLSMETRLIIAFVLMGAVLFLTPYIYKPAQPLPPAKAPAAKSVTQVPAAPSSQSVPAQAAAPKAKVQPVKAVKPVVAEQEETVLVDTALYKVQFSNRGAVVRSWVLKKFTDNAGKQLELVNASAAPKTGYPFAIIPKNVRVSADPNQVLYKVDRSSDGLGVAFTFSDGRLTVKKSFRFDPSKHLSQVSSEVTQDGTPVPHLLAWRGGYGDNTVPNPATTQRSLHFDLAQNKLIVNEAKAAKDGPLGETGRYSFAGIEDAYFAAVFLPGQGASLEIDTFADSLPTAADPNKQEPRVGVGVGGAVVQDLQLFVGPKDIDLLKRVDPKLEQLVDFGWFSFLAKPLFVCVNWTRDHVINNYGWAIVLVTVAINFLLLPLKISSLKSMKKMSTLQPQIKAINAKYAGLSLRDPKKTQQNQEIMDLYKKNGVNPTGGCLPMVLQIPFFFAFYKVLSVAIEMRGAEWLWVTDLSQPEHLPIRILPVAMILTQFVLQKMTPATSADPTQQRVMLLMPLMLGFMFYGVSSGLVLYWLTGNLVGIAQQWVFNRTVMAQPVEVTPPQKSKKSGRK
ncbi:MAG: membrane protein insertase YidC [Acidobacteriales bacterium]|nr:membrane protein insertase YidC [Terriglobales bacterium]